MFHGGFGKFQGAIQFSGSFRLVQGVSETFKIDFRRDPGTLRGDLEQATLDFRELQGVS